MASKPGILTEWPWTWLGNFKYVVLAPWAIHSTYTYLAKDKSERDLTQFAILPFLLSRMLHNQIWISLSRYRTAKGNRIVDKNIEFEQVDRERNWDDQIILNGILFYLGHKYIKEAHNLPWWRTDGIILTILSHAGPVEFLYYWLHRALHHHFLYSRYHSHHHSSIVTEPITSVIHPFGEHIVYFALFAIPLLTTLWTGTASLLSFAGYVAYIDLMNNMGHCNFEHIPKWLFSIYPPLKYLMYTPSYHSLHHTQFRTNFSLFMPFYDYIYGTMDQSSDALYERSLVRKEEAPDVVHLTHLTTPDSTYHLRLGFAYLASEPHESKWYLWLVWPVTVWSMIVTWIYGRTFIVERNVFKHLKLQTWAVPKYAIQAKITRACFQRLETGRNKVHISDVIFMFMSLQYYIQWQREAINSMIEDAILEAEEKGTKVLSLGLLNQDEVLNRNGELFLSRHPKLKVKLVDGSSLAVAIVLKSIPKGTTQVLLRGNLTKIAYSIALALCQGGILVNTIHEDEYKKLKANLSGEAGKNLILSKYNLPRIWLVGDGVTDDEQQKASKGTIFIPFSPFPPKKIREDCSYTTTPAMLAPKHLENVDSCENWLPRRVMSAWRIAGILHAVEEWNVHECGKMMLDIEKIWQASLEHGFRPLTASVESKQN